jgi:hypothetical protein
MRFKILQEQYITSFIHFAGQRRIFQEKKHQKVNNSKACTKCLVWFVLERPDLSIPGPEHTSSGVNAGK